MHSLSGFKTVNVHPYTPHPAQAAQSYAYTMSSMEHPRQQARALSCRTSFGYRGAADLQNATHVQYAKPGMHEAYALCSQAVVCGLGRRDATTAVDPVEERAACMREFSDAWKTQPYHVNQAMVHEQLACAQMASDCTALQACIKQPAVNTNDTAVVVAEDSEPDTIVKIDDLLYPSDIV